MLIERKNFFNTVANDYRLSVSSHGYVTTDESWSSVTVMCPFSRIYYVMEGRAHFITEKGDLPIIPGRVYFAPCGCLYGFEGDPAVTKLFFHINIITPDGYDLFSNSTQIVSFERSYEELGHLLKLYRSKSPTDGIALKSELWRTAVQAAECLAKERGKYAHSETVRNAIVYIRKNLSPDLKVGEVANAVFCSSGTLSAHFKKEMGMSTAEYIEDLIMFKAQGLLLSRTDKSIGDISTQLGFCDQFYFSRRFKKKFGISPKNYRNSRSES